MKFKKKIIFNPAFDKRNDDPKKNYGIHCAECSFYLIGEKGVVHFRFFTNWFLPELSHENTNKPMAVDIGYHSPYPMYEGQRKMSRCDFLPDGCYYDGSGVQAEKYLEILICEGSDAVWEKMKKYYHERFDDADPEMRKVNDVPFGELLNAMFSPNEKEENT